MSRKLRGLLKLNALPVAIALVGTITVGTGAVVTAVMRETPLFSNHQRQEIESIVQKHPILIGIAAGWLLGTTIVQVQEQIRKYQRESTHNAAPVGQAWQSVVGMIQRGELQVVRGGEEKPYVLPSPQCRNCRYLFRDFHAYAYLPYPCAVHLKGPDPRRLLGLANCGGFP